MFWDNIRDGIEGCEQKQENYVYHRMPKNLRLWVLGWSMMDLSSSEYSKY